MNKKIIATTSLAGCFGCHMSILDIDEKILDLVDLVEFNKSPLNDIKTFTKTVDIGIIEGGCSNSENVHILKEFRKNCKIIVSLGECAIMGGLPALRNTIPIKDCLAEAYLDGPTTLNETGVIPNDKELPMMLDSVYPCHEVVKVDYFIPGCPPRAELIWKTLFALISENQVDIPYEVRKYD